MRNAEKFLSQGKIALAIAEFRQVVTNDPRDHSTLNMLGDLYVKNGDSGQAVECYTTVAEHYAQQGFAQKAIAVYNKLSKLKPGSPETVARLAALYKEKGSITEARTHYEQLAAHFERSGSKLEALETWQHIAELDPNNAEAFLTIAERFRTEGFRDNAGSAFVEAGRRFVKRDDNGNAFEAFEKALECMPATEAVLKELINSAFECDRGDAAVQRVEEHREHDRHNREVHSLLVDCYVRQGNLAAAETSLVELVEHEPASYPKLLELSRLYINEGNEAGAARTLSMSSEHLLMDGRAEDLRDLASQILLQDPEHVDALRMQVRCCSWLKDDGGFKESLYLLKDAARTREAPDDEQWALSQIVMIAPQETDLAERLRELNLELGIEDEIVGESLFDKRFVSRAIQTGDSGFEIAGVDVSGFPAAENSPGPGRAPELGDSVSLPITGHSGEIAIEVPADDIVASTSEDQLQREIDSIRFYIESGYNEIAEKALAELRAAHGDTDQVRSLVEELNGSSAVSSNAATSASAISVQAPAAETGSISGSFDLNDLRNELGFDDSAEDDLSGDYETHYNTAIAYQEMHLLQDSIKEFQQAIALIEPNDGTRRFFQCANLLGHCFMQLGKANLAVRWFLRTLETADITDDERMGIWYELALAYDADRDHVNASRYFEQVYAENINFRDVADRVNSMVAAG